MSLFLVRYHASSYFEPPLLFFVLEVLYTVTGPALSGFLFARCCRCSCWGGGWNRRACIARDMGNIKHTADADAGQLHYERDLGVPIDVIDPRNYLLPKNPVPLPPEDEALLNWREGDGPGSSTYFCFVPLTHSGRELRCSRFCFREP